jgi:hypothetical protein
MIERKDGETDASWIGRLEAAYKALLFACEKQYGRLKELDGIEKDLAAQVLISRKALVKADMCLNLLEAMRYDPMLGAAFKSQIESLLTIVEPKSDTD